MALSNDIISQFVKATNDKPETKKEATVYGTTVEYGGRMFVRIDGSDLLTPISTTADVKEDERVTVTIKDHTATVTGNISSPSARTDDVKDVANQITEFEIVMAYKVSTTDLEAIIATIDSLRAKTAYITEADISHAEIINAEIDKLKATYAELDHVDAKDITALTADIEKIKSMFAEVGSLTADEIDAVNADIDQLKAYNADFTYVSAEVLEAMKASIKTLDVKKLSAEQADLKYANIDFSNIGEAAMEYFYAKSGLIKDVVVGDGTITGELIGVTIKGDLIEGNTVVADKLVIKGEDGIYYKLNTEGGVEPDEQITKEKLQNGLHGEVIITNSIAAEKINVHDLVAFDATIGGFNITDDSIYSGVKSSIDNTTRGIYFDNTGQIAFGDSSNYLKYYKDSDGYWRLQISAGSIRLGGSSNTVEEAIDDIKSEMETIKDEVTTNLRIESSRGTVFKNSAVSTVLSAVIYRGSQRITDITALKEAMGSSAYLQWSWQRLDETSYGIISATDSRIGNDGFTFTLTPEDVDTKVTFMCELMT